MGRKAKRGRQGKRLGRWVHLSKKDFTSWLESTGTTAAALASQLGVSGGLISSWKAGRRFPSEVNQKLLAEIVTAKPAETPSPRGFDPRRFKAWRLGRQMSRKALAEELGVSAGSIAAWEHGKTKPRASTLAKMKKAMSAKGFAPGSGDRQRAKSGRVLSSADRVAAIESAGRVVAALASKGRLEHAQLLDLAPRLRDSFLRG